MPKKNTIEFVKEKLLEKNIRLLEETYISNCTKMKMLCLTCDFIFLGKFGNFYCQKYMCPSCVSKSKKREGIKKRHDFDYIKQIAEEKGFELLSNEYIDNKKKLQLRCKKCGKENQISFNKISRNRGCHFCKGEKQRNTLLKKYGVSVPCKNPTIALKAARNTKKSFILYHWKTGEKLICQASYEKKVVEYLNQNKIDFWWQQYTFIMPNTKTYRPDLYLVDENKWVEIKGYFRKPGQEKWEWFCKNRSNTELWDKQILTQKGIL